MNLKEHIPHFVAEHKKAIAVLCCHFNHCNNYIVMSHQAPTMMVSQYSRKKPTLLAQQTGKKKRKKRYGKKKVRS